MVMKKKLRLYTTYGKLLVNGKPSGGKYPVRIMASSKKQAIILAKRYHASWNRNNKEKKYRGIYAGIKQ